MEVKATTGFQLWHVHLESGCKEITESYVVWATNEAHAFYKASLFLQTKEKSDGSGLKSILVWEEYNDKLEIFLQLERAVSDKILADIEVGKKSKDYVENKIKNKEYFSVMIFPLTVIV